MAGLDSLNLVKRRLYCGGPFIGMRRWLAPMDLRPSFDIPWPQLHDRTVIGTFRGRTAIALACRLLGLNSGDEVLVPAYNCGTELDALLQAGLRLSAYRVSRKGEIAIEDLARQRTNRTKAVYVIHYFGWEQPLPELQRWCDSEGLLLIEDCALALFSHGPSGRIGRTGSAAIFSLPKTLGNHHGGLITLPTSRSCTKPQMAQPGLPILLKEIYISAKAAAFAGLERLGLYGPLLGARGLIRRQPVAIDDETAHPEMPPGYYFDPVFDADRELHPRTKAAVASLDWQGIIKQRRTNFSRLAEALAGMKGIEPLFPQLPNGVCPLSFPILVSDRDSSVAYLQASGIAALPWWAGFHRNAIDWSKFSDACWLKRHLLTLPVHQGLDERHMAYVVETVARIASL